MATRALLLFRLLTLLSLTVALVACQESAAGTGDSDAVTFSDGVEDGFGDSIVDTGVDSAGDDVWDSAFDTVVDSAEDGIADAVVDTPMDGEVEPDVLPEPPPFGSLVFSQCHFLTNVECAPFTVPINHEDVRAGTLDLTAYRLAHVGDGPALGTLVYSNGGPGSVVRSGDLPYIREALGPEIAAAFDLLAWSQRAQYGSGHIDCGNTSNLFRSGDFSPDDALEEAALDALLASFAADCEAAAGALLPHVGPVDHARDLEWLRIGAGLDEIFFYAPSYASMYATLYAELFPTRLRRAVLDSPISSSRSLVDWARGQFGTILARLEVILAACDADPGCVFRPEGGARKGVLDLHAALDGNAGIPQADFEIALTEAPFVFGAEEEYIEAAPALLEAARLGDRSWIDVVLGEALRPADEGNYLAQVCMHDVRPTIPELDALRQELHAQMPPLAAYFSSFVRLCAHWPVEGKRAAAPVVAPPDTFLVVGGSRDYAVPVIWPEQLASELDAPLVVSPAYGHPALGNDMPDCVRAAVVGWLLEGTTPLGCQ